MARITVEDCLKHVGNRFSLVLITAERTKQLLKGAEPKVEVNQGNKEIVIALREIGAGIIKYYEKDPEEVPAEVAAEEVLKAVQKRQLALEREVPPPPPPSRSDSREDHDDDEDGDTENPEDDNLDDDEIDE